MAISDRTLYSRERPDYDYYRTVSRGKREKRDPDNIVSPMLESEGSSKTFTRKWGHLYHNLDTQPQFTYSSSLKK
jgi:hypothetical protein